MIKYIILTLCALLFSQMAGAVNSNRIFVTNERSDDVTVINSRTLEVETTIPVGKRPRGIGLSPDRSELYIALSDENSIAVLDPHTLNMVRKFSAGSDPETFAVHPNGHIYISNEDEAMASVYNPANGELIAVMQVGLEPEGVAISKDGSRVIITSESTNLLHVIEVPQHTIIANILVGARPRAAVFSEDGKRVYATSEIGGEISLIDMETFTVTNRRKIADDNAKPKDLLLSVDENYLFVAGGRANQVIVLETRTLSPIRSIPTGKRVWGLAMDRYKKRLFTTDGISSTVTVIDTATYEIIKTISAGKFPWGIVIDD